MEETKGARDLLNWKNEEEKNGGGVLFLYITLLCCL